MSLPKRLAKLEDAQVARVNQQAKYFSDNPMEVYLAMVQDNTHKPKTVNGPQVVGLDPNAAYQLLISITGTHDKS
jgi:hypothetical protein